MMLLVFLLYGTNVASQRLKLDTMNRLLLQGGLFLAFMVLKSVLVGTGTQDKGRRAPKLTDHGLKMIQGEAPKGPRGGRPYVLEFWATWCGPCVRAIPHLSKLYQIHKKKVDFVGVSSEDADKVRSFLREKNEEHHAEEENDSDDDETSTSGGGGRGGTEGGLFYRYPCAISSSLASACGVTGLPTVWVVDRKGRVFWSGHPNAEEFEGALQAVADGETAECEEEGEKEDEVNTGGSKGKKGSKRKGKKKGKKQR